MTLTDIASGQVVSTRPMWIDGPNARSGDLAEQNRAVIADLLRLAGQPLDGDTARCCSKVSPGSGSWAISVSRATRTQTPSIHCEVQSRPTRTSRCAMTSATPTTFAEVALQLHASGYRPFPCVQDTKVPAMRGWPGLNLMPWDAADLTATITDYQPDSAYACGMAIQSGLVAIDIDILDHTAAVLADELANKHLGRTPLVRIGQAPKQLRIYRQGGGVTSRKLHPVEIFSGSGQCVGYGQHQKTGQPYYWPDASPLELVCDSPDIPKVTRAQLDRFTADLFKVVPRRQQAAHSRQQNGNLTLNERLRLLTIRYCGNWNRAAAQLLSEAREGNRNDTMWAVVASAAGRGVPEDELAALFDRHFAGWEGVTPDAVENAIARAYAPRSRTDGCLTIFNIHPA